MYHLCIVNILCYIILYYFLIVHSTETSTMNAPNPKYNYDFINVQKYISILLGIAVHMGMTFKKHINLLGFLFLLIFNLKM